ncbi:MAG: DUF3078 domain-containing protein [Fibrobacteres bacterium]|nr:DUF3078 domain-containing protein [Fibrobacterota bacterium]
MKKKRIIQITILIIAFTVTNLFADPWKYSLNSNVLLTLNTFSESWSGGDAGSFNWSSQAIGAAEKNLSEKISNRNTLKLAFGQSKTQDKTTKKWSIPVKSTDLIDFESLLKFSLGGFVDPFAAVNVLSQFTDLRDTATVRYFNQFDIKESFGAMRDIVKKDNTTWTSRLGITVRQLLDRNNTDSMTNDGGIELVSELKTKNTSGNVQLTSTLKLYEALISSASENAPNNDWRHPHANWENVLSFNVAKYIMFGVYVQLLYDKEINKSVRLKETVSLGLTYSFDGINVKK